MSAERTELTYSNEQDQLIIDNDRLASSVALSPLKYLKQDRVSLNALNQQYGLFLNDLTSVIKILTLFSQPMITLVAGKMSFMMMISAFYHKLSV